MDETPDPLTQFFPPSLAEQQDILYTTLEIAPSATSEEIRKSYRKLALRYHPDKHVSKGEEEKEETGRVFQRVGFAYAVLSDEGRRKRYDATGRTDENAFAGAEEMGWDAYFETLFQRIDRKILDEDKAKYQGSAEERQDLIDAYESTNGAFHKIVQSIPHSSHADEPRFIEIITDLITSGELEETKQWKKTSTDKAASSARGKSAAKEAKEAEKAAKELGVWDEFYGSGAKGSRKGEGEGEAEGENGGGKGKGKGKGKRKSNGDEPGQEEDALAALILKRQKNREGGLDAMAEKYRKMEEEARAKKGKKGRKSDQENEGPPDISDADFAALQAKMFGDKDKGGKGKGKGSKTKA